MKGLPFSSSTGKTPINGSETQREVGECAPAPLSIIQSRDIPLISHGLRHLADDALSSLHASTLKALENAGAPDPVKAYFSGLVAIRREIRRRLSPHADGGGGPVLAEDRQSRRSASSELRPILLVEDNRKDLDLALEAFEEVGLANDIVVARDGEEALAFLFPPSVEKVLPAVIVLDLKLPKIGGLEVLRRIKSDAATRQIPVVVLTSSQEERDVAASYEAGGNAFVVKPTRFADFVQSIRTLATFWTGLNEPPPGSRRRRRGTSQE